MALDEGEEGAQIRLAQNQIGKGPGYPGWAVTEDPVCLRGHILVQASLHLDQAVAACEQSVQRTIQTVCFMTSLALQKADPFRRAPRLTKNPGTPASSHEAVKP